MRTVSLKALFISLIFAATVATKADAAFISSDWLGAGDNLITIDTGSGLEWLDLSETYNLSSATVAPLLATTYAGFRFATHAEVLGLMTNAGLPTPAVVSTVSSGNAAHIAAATALTSLLSETVGAHFGPIYNGSRGHVEELGGSVVGYYLINGTDLFIDNSCCHDSFPGAGVWLVREGGSPVPTPTALILLAFGAAIPVLRNRKS